MICTRCNHAMEVLENNVVLIDGVSEDTAHHNVRRGDLCVCDECGTQVVAGLGRTLSMDDGELRHEEERRIVIKV